MSLPSSPEFDRVASGYDATRPPLSGSEVAVLAAAFAGHRRILEVGVGTGRVSVPLSERGFEMLGVDLSRAMLVRARAKGLPALVRADAHRLPFGDRCVDAALFVHVLQLVDDWRPVLREAARVSGRTVAVVTRPRGVEGEEVADRTEWHRRYRETRERLGVPSRRGPRFWQNEGDLVASIPPDEFLALRDERIEWDRPTFERHLRDRVRMWTVAEPLAPALEDALMAELMAAGPRTYPVHRHRIEALAIWRAERLRSLA